MRKLSYNEKKSLYYNWFRLKSKMLFPESPKRQKKAFDYLYYRFVLKHRKDSPYRLKRVAVLMIAQKLDKLIGQRKFLKELAERRVTIQTAGIAGRLMLSMAHHNFPEPSVNKIKLLYSYRFKDKKTKFDAAEEKMFLATEKQRDSTPANELAVKSYTKKEYRGNVGEAYVGNSLDTHRDVLPYCVAHTLCRPEVAETCDDFMKEVDKFLYLSEAYKLYCLNHVQSRKAEGSKAFVDIERMLEVDFWPLPPAKVGDIKVYSLESMLEYAERAGIRSPEGHTTAKPNTPV